MSSNVTITRIINEKRNPQRATYQKIAHKFPQYNIEWLINGTGETYNRPKDTEIVSAENENANYETNKNNYCLENIGFIEAPLVHVQAQCEYVSGYANREYIETLPTLPVIADRAYDGKYRLFEVNGDSMDNDTRNAIRDGDIVLAREIQRAFWATRLHIKAWYFVIVHRADGISIKQITEHDAQHGTILCHSLNDMFVDHIVDLDDVSELYHLIKIVDRSARL